MGAIDDNVHREKEHLNMLRLDDVDFRDRNTGFGQGSHKATTRDGEVTSGRQGWRQVLYEFSQNTTIHGVRQIGEDTPFTIRR